MNSIQKPILKINNLKMHFPIKKGVFGRVVGHVKAVDDVTLTVNEGEVVGLVGESGCGKSTLSRCIVRAYKPTAGEILLYDEAGHAVDLAKLSEAEMHPYRQNVQMVFQDPFASLNPRMTLKQIIGEPMRNYGLYRGKALEERVAYLLESVGLRPEHMSRYPHAFSGGQRQRVGIARALALNPRLIICDEPVSALDVSVQAQILNLLRDLQSEFGYSYLFIAHDLSVVDYVCDRVAVMYVGKIVETTNTETLFQKPQHPYTAALLSAIPKLDPRLRQLPIPLEGEIADPANAPAGCVFHPRCQYAKDQCRHEVPELRETDDGHRVRCHFAGELTFEELASATSDSTVEAT